MFTSFDYVVIAVRDTEQALELYRDRFGLEVLFSINLPDQPLPLTHLDMGNAHLQRIQTLSDERPVKAWQDVHGEGLHCFCSYLNDMAQTFEVQPGSSTKPMKPTPGAGSNGRQAGFIDPATTNRLPVEATSAPSESDPE